MRSGGYVGFHGLSHASEVGNNLGLVGDLGCALGRNRSLVTLRGACHGQVVGKDCEVSNGESFTSDERSVAALLSKPALDLLVELLEVLYCGSYVFLLG